MHALGLRKHKKTFFYLNIFKHFSPHNPLHSAGWMGKQNEKTKQKATPAYTNTMS